MDSSHWSLALSCDDAPTTPGDGSVLTADPTRMDRVRETLKRHSVPHCVAFVIGVEAEKDPGPLKRWLEAGYSLGNHTFFHDAASGQSEQQFVDSLRRCDALLSSLGAFDDGASRWFRFPYLDRGRSEAHRRALAAACRELGYGIASASVDTFDHRYERPFAEASLSGDASRRDRVVQRFLRTAVQSLEGGQRAFRASLGASVPLVPYFHLGHVCDAALGPMLTHLVNRSTRWMTLGEALAHPAYQAFDQDFSCSGLALPPSRRSLVRAALRRAGALSERFGLFEQDRLGPCWPQL